MLLDECVNPRIAASLTGHEVTSTRRAGWAGKKNGELLRLAATRFDVFVTADRGIAFQQNLAVLPLSIMVLRPRGNRLPPLLALVPNILARLEQPLEPLMFVWP